MSISFDCQCGGHFSVKDELAGKKGKCPKCGQVLTIPKPPKPEEDFGEYELAEEPAPSPRPVVVDASYRTPQGERRTAPVASLEATGPAPFCPSCKQKLRPGAKICVACGIHVHNGRPLILSQDLDENVLHENVQTVAKYLSWLLPIGLFPVASDAYGRHRPLAIRTIAIVTAVISVAFWSLDAGTPGRMGASGPFLLWTGSKFNPVFALVGVTPGRFHWYQLLTNIFLHGGIMHLAGNLIFLLVFGNRINALLGQWKSAVLYIVLGIAASATFYISQIGGRIEPALGASGAIMGMAGMYFVLMPVSRVYMVFWVRLGLLTGFRRYTKIFAVRGFWVLLFYIAFDVIAAALGSRDGTAHWAHLGGFLSGMLVATALLLFRVVDPGGADLITAILGKGAWKLLGTPAERAAKAQASQGAHAYAP